MNDVTATTSRLGQFMKTFGKVEAGLEASLEPLGLSLPKFLALSHLAAAGEPLPLSALAERQACVRSNITQLIDRLEADQLVKRSDDPRDRRSVRAELTDEGRSRYEAGLQALLAAERDLFAPLDAAQQDQLFELLAVLRGDR
jgi:DNA-binding MarR family transcriptional regulator